MEFHFSNRKHENDFVLLPVSKFEARRIRKGLKEQAFDIESTRLVGLRDELESKLDDSSISEDEKKEIKRQINSVQRKIYNVRLLPEDILFDVSASAFDWTKISIQNVWIVNLFKHIPGFLIIRVSLPQFGRSRTPDQLRLHWQHYLRPGVNTSSWTHNENKMLKVNV